MIKREWNKEQLTDYAKQHRFCLELSLGFLRELLKEYDHHDLNPEEQAQLFSHEPATVSSFNPPSGRAWLEWFLADVAPKKIKETAEEAAKEKTQ